MAATEQTEIERKYEVNEAAQVPDLTVVDGVAEVMTHGTFTLSAVYYDTEGLDLAARSISLRRREGGADEGWHIKKPVAEGRTELHWPLDTADPTESGNQVASRAAEDEVPDAVLEPARAIVRDRAVSPVARVTTTRTAVHLLNDRGDPVAELADDKVRASDLRGGEFRAWREWEVEFLEAAPPTPEERTAFLDAVEAVLATAGAHPSASRSKLAHTLGADALTDAAAGAGPAAATPDTQTTTHAATAGLVVVQALRHQVNALIEADPAVRADEPDAVHGMRRTVRRLRSLLAGYEPLFDAAAVDRLRDDLKRLGQALGEARDAEVRKARAAKLLDSLSTPDPQARERLVGGDQREYDAALDRLRRVLAGQQYYRLLDALEEFAQAPPLTDRAARPAEKEIPKEVLRQVKRMLERADAIIAADEDPAGDSDSGSDDAVTAARREAAMHEVRKAARRLRYAVTALKVPGMYKPPRKLREIAAAVKPIEKALGGHRDKVLFAEQVQISAQRARAEGEDTYVYGLLSGDAGDPADADQDQPAASGADAHRDRLLRNLKRTTRTVEKLAKKL